jgi:uncharacterized membrane protein
MKPKTKEINSVTATGNVILAISSVLGFALESGKVLIVVLDILHLI